MTNTYPTPAAGHNEAPDYGKQISEALARDNAELVRNVEDLIAEADRQPTVVNDDETMGQVADVARRLRDLTQRIDGIRKVEKEPHLRAEQAVDGFFFGLFSRVMRRNNTDNMGAFDRLQKVVDDYNQRKLAEERRRRAEAERLASEARQKAVRAAQEARRLQAESEAAAARSRKPENVEAHMEQAAGHASTAALATAQAQVARDRHVDAREESQAKPADMVRQRTEGGAMVTAARVPYIEITDPAALDAKALWPYIKHDEMLRAVKEWAKVTQHRQPMAGAIIEMRNKTVIR